MCLAGALAGPCGCGDSHSWAGHELQGASAVPGPLGVLGFAAGSRDALLHVSACYSLCMTTKAVLRQPLPLWQQILVHTRVCTCFALEEQGKLSASCRVLWWVTALLGKG